MKGLTFLLKAVNEQVIFVEQRHGKALMTNEFLYDSFK
jgi:hypothetical protein